MSLCRRNPKRDANEPIIVAALRDVGAQVLRLDVFDLLVLHHQRLFMLEAKVPKGRKTDRQEALIAAGWPLTYVETPEAALKAIGAIR